MALAANLGGNSPYLIRDLLWLRGGGGHLEHRVDRAISFGMAEFHLPVNGRALVSRHDRKAVREVPAVPAVGTRIEESTYSRRVFIKLELHTMFGAPRKVSDERVELGAVNLSQSSQDEP
jgi:hypothetical protein